MLPSTEVRPWLTDPRYLVGDDGTITGPSGRSIGTPHRFGYKVISYNSAAQRRSTTAHAMVCETFHGPRPDGAEAAHLNGDPADARAVNLAWKMPTGNAADKLRHGTHGHRLTRAEAAEIRASSASRNVLAVRYGVTPGTISHVRTGFTWREDYAAAG